MKKVILFAFIFSATLSFSQNWTTSLEAAKTEAASSNKNILLVFSGSDWCAPCIKLDRTIFQTEVFKAEAAQKWVLVKADFPKKKGNLLSVELTDSNKKLAEKYNKEGNFPLVVLLDNTGKIIGILGYKNVTPEAYIQLINNLIK
jgi:thioredoxin-related protein